MKKILIKLIEMYQHTNISTHAYCKFTPTCSEYTKEAIIEYGSLKGLWLGFKRILRCNPFSKGGNDPLIKKEKR